MEPIWDSLPRAVAAFKIQFGVDSFIDSKHSGITSIAERSHRSIAMCVRLVSLLLCASMCAVCAHHRTRGLMGPHKAVGTELRLSLLLLLL